MKKKIITIIPEKISISSINIFKARMDTTDTFLEKPKKAEHFEFGMSNEVAHDFENRRIRCRVYLTLEARNGDNDPLGLTLDYGLEFHFHVENFPDFYRKGGDGEFGIDGNLAATILGMAYSTARGIVYERTRGTFFDGILLPVIDPYKALEDVRHSDRKSSK